MILSFTPTVETKYPTDQIPLPSRYTFDKNGKRLFSAELVLDLMIFTAWLTLILGGIATRQWTWSDWIFLSRKTMSG